MANSTNHGNSEKINIGPCWVGWNQGGSIATHAYLKTLQGLVIFARDTGVAGNAYSVVLVDPSSASQELSVSFVGSVLTVNLATNASSQLISTVAEVAAAIKADEDAHAVLSAVYDAADASEVVAAAASASLAGGAAASGTIVWLGYTKGGVTVKLSTETYSVEVDQETSSIYDTIIKQLLNVTVPLAEFTAENLQRSFPGSIIVKDPDDETKVKVMFKSAVGEDMNDLCGVLILHPKNKADDDLSEDFTFVKANPSGEFEWKFVKNEEKITNLTYTPRPDAEGTYGIFGDPSIFHIPA